MPQLSSRSHPYARRRFHSDLKCVCDPPCCVTMQKLLILSAGHKTQCSSRVCLIAPGHTVHPVTAQQHCMDPAELFVGFRRVHLKHSRPDPFNSSSQQSRPDPFSLCGSQICRSAARHLHAFRCPTTSGDHHCIGVIS